MVNIADTSSAQPSRAFQTTGELVWNTLKNINKVLISEGAVNARMKKLEMLNRKSDEELAEMGLCREDIIRISFYESFDVFAELPAKP